MEFTVAKDFSHKQIPLHVFMFVCCACPFRGYEGQVFSQRAKQIFGLSTHHTVWKLKKNKTHTHAEESVEIEECSADVNWKEMCNQILLTFSNVKSKL